MPSHPLRVEMGHRVLLLGYDLDSEVAGPGRELSLTLYWKALAPMEVDYKVFIHLEKGRIWGQYDGLPLCGFYRTSDWRPGDVIVERYRIPIAPETPPGTYPLLVGMYNPADGKRLEIFDENGNLLGDSFTLGVIAVLKDDHPEEGGDHDRGNGELEDYGEKPAHQPSPAGFGGFPGAFQTEALHRENP